MFRLAQNVPEIYVQKSRDFQLFTRLYDAVFNGVKYSTDAVLMTLDAKDCNQSLLELLKTKLGLFTDVSLTEHELRCVLQAFPTIVKHKGSWQGVDDILNLFQRMNRNHGDRGYVNKDTANDTYEVILEFNKPLTNDKLLMELLRYVLPTGYTVVYKVAETSVTSTILNLNDTVIYETTSLNSIHEAAMVDDQITDLRNTAGLTYTSEEKVNE